MLIIIPTLQTQAAPPPPVVTMLIENDLAVELQDEYDPLAPNNYESIYQERKVKQEKVREEEVRLHNYINYNNYYTCISRVAHVHVHVQTCVCTTCTVPLLSAHNFV